KTSRCRSCSWSLRGRSIGHRSGQGRRGRGRVTASCEGPCNPSTLYYGKLLRPPRHFFRFFPRFAPKLADSMHDGLAFGAPDATNPVKGERAANPNITLARMQLRPTGSNLTAEAGPRGVGEDSTAEPPGAGGSL